MFIKVAYPGLKFRSRKTLSCVDTVTDLWQKDEPSSGVVCRPGKKGRRQETSPPELNFAVCI